MPQIHDVPQPVFPLLNYDERAVRQQERGAVHKLHCSHPDERNGLWRRILTSRPPYPATFVLAKVSYMVIIFSLLFAYKMDLSQAATVWATSWDTTHDAIVATALPHSSPSSPPAPNLRVSPDLLWGSLVDFSDPNILVLSVSLSGGQDSGPGSLAQPFATLQRALTEAASALSLSMPTYIVLRQGIYTLLPPDFSSSTNPTPPLRITLQRSSAAPLVIMAYPNEAVMFTAATAIPPGAWQMVSANNPAVGAGVDTSRLRLLDVR